MKSVQDSRRMTRHATVGTLFIAMGLSLGVQAQDAASTRSLVYLGFQQGPGVPESAHAALGERIVAAIPGAAKERSFAVVSLDKVSGLRKSADECHDMVCRQDIAKRLKAEFLLSARIERLGVPEEAPAEVAKSPVAAPRDRTRIERKSPFGIKDDRPVDIAIRRPVGLTFGDPGRKQRATKGYRLSVWLEGDGGRLFVDGYKLDGEVPFLVGQISAAILRVLESASPKRVAAMRRLTGTAQSYQKAGRSSDAARTYRRAVSMNPLHPDAAKLQLALIDVLQSAGETDQMLAAMDEAVDMYGPRTAWARGGIGGEAVQADVRAALKSTLLAAGTTAHQKYNTLTDAAAPADAAAAAAAKKEAAEAFKIAQRAYEAFRSGFHDDPQAAEISLYDAELHYAAGRLDAAIEKYIAIRDGETTQAADAGVAVMAALKSQIDDDVKAGKAKAYDLNVNVLKAPVVKMAAPYPSSVERFQAEAYAFAKVHPRHKDAPIFVYQTMLFAAMYGHLGDAKKALEVLKKDFPRSRATSLAKQLRPRL